MTLETTEKQLLFELDSNSRRSLAELGRKLQLLPETVNYKIQRLKQLGIIQGHVAVMNSACLGFMHHKVLLRLQNASEAEIQTIIRFAVGLPNVMRVLRFDGEFDLDIVVKVSRLSEFDACLSDLTEKFYKFIRHRSVAVNVWARYLPRHYLIEKNRRNPLFRGYDSSSSLVPVDHIDQFLLQQLGRNSRVTGAELERMLEDQEDLPAISSVALLQRIRRLEQNEIIKGYKLIIDSGKIGYFGYKILLYLNSRAERELNTFVQYCATNMNVVRLIKTIGRWDFELDVEFQSKAELRALLGDLSKRFPQLIRDHTTLDYLSLEKYASI